MSQLFPHIFSHIFSPGLSLVCQALSRLGVVYQAHGIPLNNSVNEAGTGQREGVLGGSPICLTLGLSINRMNWASI